MAAITLTPPPFPADANLFYRDLLDLLPSRRSVYTKDRTAIGLRSSPVTISGSADPGTVVQVFHSTFDRPSAFLTEVQANPVTGLFTFMVQPERGTNFIQAISGGLESNIISLNAFNLHLYLEAFGDEFLVNLLPLLEQAIADQNIEDTQNILSGGTRSPTTQGLRDNLGSLVNFRRPSIFTAAGYRNVLRTILQRVVRRTTTVDAQRELFRAFTGALPVVDEYYRRRDFLLTSDLFVSVVRSSVGSPGSPSLTVHLNQGFIHIGQHQNLVVIAQNFAVVNNAVNYLVADGSFQPSTTLATVYVTAIPTIPAFVQIPEVDPRFQFQMRLSLDDRFDGGNGDTGWVTWAPSVFIPLTIPNTFVPLFIKFRDSLGVEFGPDVVRAEIRVFATITAVGGDIVGINGVDALGSDGPIVLSILSSQYRFLLQDRGASPLTSDQKTELDKFVRAAKPAHHGAYVKFQDETFAREV